jgi:hypothetical protein
VVVVGLSLYGSGAFALIIGGFGNDPVPDHDWPDGSLAIANHKSRLGWWEGPPFGGGQYTFLFRGDAKAFNEALELLARINTPAVELHIHRGPHESFWLVDREEAGGQKPQANDKKENAAANKKRDPRIDWSFTVWTPRSFHNLYNNPTSLFSSDRPDFRRAVPAPKIDVYVGGGLIDWKDVSVPKGIKVVGPSADAIENSDRARLKLQVYDMISSKPVKDARLRLIASGADGQKEVATATANEKGVIELDDIAPGTYDLRIEAEGYAPRALGWEQLEQGGVKDVSTELSPQTTITGRVITSKDQPVAGANVHTFVLLGIDGRGYAMPSRAEVTTDENGKFEMKLPAGYVQLSARAPDLYHSWTEILPVGKRWVSPDQAEPIAIRMAKTTTVTVRVTNPAGKPVRGLAVSLEPTGNPIGKWGSSGTTDDQEKVVIEGVPPGEYQITDRVGSEKKGKAFSVSGGKPSEIELKW